MAGLFDRFSVDGPTSLSGHKAFHVFSRYLTFRLNAAFPTDFPGAGINGAEAKARLNITDGPNGPEDTDADNIVAKVDALATSSPWKALAYITVMNGAFLAANAGFRQSGVTTASQAGTTVTASGGGFTFKESMVGDTIEWDDASIAVIRSVTSDTVVEVDRTQSVSAQAFAVRLITETAWRDELDIPFPT